MEKQVKEKAFLEIRYFRQLIDVMLRLKKKYWQQLKIKFENLKLKIHAMRRQSSRLQMFFKIGFLRNFTIFTGKYLCWSLFYVKL